MTPILAVIVLYRIRLEESSTWRAIRDFFGDQPGATQSIRILIADNSPQPQVMPPDFSGIYVHDGQNLGLAARYNEGLAQAASSGAPWLLLFDQDTTPTPEYFREMLELSRALLADRNVAVIVPKLVMNGRILSPHAPLYRTAPYIVDSGSSGVLGDNLRAFNSGALVRVSAVQEIGGFPLTYWLDYLDHATFHLIQAAGGQIYVMKSSLAHELHELSEAIPGKAINPERVINRLKAEERFYSEFGSYSERIRRRVGLARQAIGLARQGHLAQAKLHWKALMHFS